MVTAVTLGVQRPAASHLSLTSTACSTRQRYSPASSLTHETTSGQA